jgi:predicted ATPase/DNA-binding CsgD family transcriptional regulator
MEPMKQLPEDSGPATSLPVYLTRFVGREEEVATLTSLLQDKRLLTLVGAGGIGKTRLALEVASKLSAFFADGVYLIELAPLSDPQLVPQEIASTLNMRTDRDMSLIALLKSELAQRHVLLLLDNCEHVIDECATLVEALLQTCPNLHILGTSREPLRVAGETTWRVTALSSPDPEQRLAVEKLMRYEAIQLFCERAMESNPRFQLTPQNATTVACICARLDGLPLALELAAALLPMYSVDQLAARMDERFKLLRYGKRTVEARHHSLEAALDWSFALLTPREQALFPRLAVFAGSWDIEAMECICASDNFEPPLIAETLVYLVNKSLIVAEEQEGAEKDTAEIRYRLLHTMRQYGLEKLRQDGDFEQVLEQHYAWYLSLAEEANAHIYGGEQAKWLQRLEMETANMRAALSRARADRRLDAAVRLADALRRFWITHNYFSEGRYWFDALLAADDEHVDRHPALSLPPELRARALFGAAEFARYQSAYDRTCTLLTEEIALLEKLEDRPGQAEAQVYLGLAMGLQGKYDQGMALCQAGLSFYRSVGDQQGIATTLATLAFITLAQGEAQEAMALSEEACQLLRETANHIHLLYALFTLAQAALFLKAIKQARAACREAIELARTQQQSYGIAASLGLIGGIAGIEGQYAQAARLFGAAQALQERVQAPHPPAGRALLERMVLSIITTFGQEKFLLHFAEGKSSPLEDILSEAEAILETPPASRRVLSPATAAELIGLSPRELEVLVLVAEGLTDAQVARYLFLSTRTVSKHLQSIYARLGINSRSAATRFAFEHGLV